MQVSIYVGDNVVTNHVRNQESGWRVQVARMPVLDLDQDRPRRSDRMAPSDVQKREEEFIKEQVQLHDPNRGLVVADIPGKGRGIRAVKGFSKGDFVLEYSGELINIGTARTLEAEYGLDPTKGCYMYYFKYQGIQYW